MHDLRIAATVITLSAGAVGAQGREGDFVLPTWRFTNGQTLSNVKLHYTTLGAPRRDAAGTTRNAVLVLHGTGGTGSGFLGAGFAGELFGPGKLLDTAQYYVILPDNIGHGKSSKPSDGLHMRFPNYGYTDMVNLQHALLTQALGVQHLRLVMGTSMGCMHAWVWGYAFAEFVDGLVATTSRGIPTGRVGNTRRLLAASVAHSGCST
jgi:homoserine O-acetyltransferase